MLYGWILAAIAAPVVPMQGAIIDANGAPLDGSHALRFVIEGRTGGGAWVPILDETVTTTVHAGAFAVGLGASAAPSWADNLGNYDTISVTTAVDGGAPSAPVDVGWSMRSVYAIRAGSAANAAQLGGVDATGYVRKSGIDAAELTLSGDTLGVHDGFVDGRVTAVGDPRYLRRAGVDAAELTLSGDTLGVQDSFVDGRVTAVGDGRYLRQGQTVPATVLPSEASRLDATATQAFAGPLSTAGNLRFAAVAGDAFAPGPCTAGGALQFTAGRFEGCDGAFWRVLSPAPVAPAVYNFEEGTGNAVTDGNYPANRGYAAGVTWVPPGAGGAPGAGCQAGGCLSFAGTTASYLALPPEILHGLTDVTISYWARGTVGRTGTYLFSVAPSVPENNHILFYGPSDGTVAHFVFRRLAGVWQAYRNGVRDDTWMYSATANPVLRTAPGGFVIGQDQDCPGGCFDSAQAFQGTIDTLMILPFPSSDATIAANGP